MTFRATITAIIAGVITPPFLILAILCSIFDSGVKGPHFIARLWARMLLRVSSVRVDISGIEKIDPEGTYIFAANHSSMFDILVLLGHLPARFCWLAKAELFKIPLFGTAMKRCGYIPVDRSNPRAGVKSLKRAAERIRNGTSVVIFPEGTRSKDGRIQSFKHGGFLLALQSHRPIVPVTISGANRVLPTQTLLLRPGPIKIIIDHPIPTTGLRRNDINHVVQKVQTAILAHHDPEYGQPLNSMGKNYV